MAISRSENMARIRPEDTRAEVRLRRALWRRGLRYRKHAKTPVGRPDIVFPGKKVAVFVDGGFWHGCPEHYVRPRGGDQFWAAKLRENVDRDRRQTIELESQGWRIVRLWECKVFTDLDACVEAVRAALDGAVADEAVDWRVVLVVPLDEDGVDERRYMEDLRDPERVRHVDGQRVTAKWKVRREHLAGSTP